MRMSILPKNKEMKTEKVKWPTVAFEQEMAEKIAKKRKKKAKKGDMEEGY